MKKSQLVQAIKEALQGHSPQIGKTKGGTTDDFRNILTAIAKQGQDSDKDSEEAKARRGNAILDKANPDNVARIIRGEKPIYEAEEAEFKVEYWYRSGDDKDFDTIKVQATSAAEAIEKAKAGARRGAMGSSFKVV
jgi:hypothetical protein